MQTDQLDRIIRIKTVLEMTGLSRSTMYRRIDNGTFPRGVKISERCVGWRLSAIAAWLRNPIYYGIDDTSD